MSLASRSAMRKTDCNLGVGQPNEHLDHAGSAAPMVNQLQMQATGSGCHAPGSGASPPGMPRDLSAQKSCGQARGCAFSTAMIIFDRIDVAAESYIAPQHVPFKSPAEICLIKFTPACLRATGFPAIAVSTAAVCLRFRHIASLELGPDGLPVANCPFRHHGRTRLAAFQNIACKRRHGFFMTFFFRSWSLAVPRADDDGRTLMATRPRRIRPHEDRAADKV